MQEKTQNTRQRGSENGQLCEGVALVSVKMWGRYFTVPWEPITARLLVSKALPPLLLLSGLLFFFFCLLVSVYFQVPTNIYGYVFFVF